MPRTHGQWLRLASLCLCSVFLSACLDSSGIRPISQAPAPLEPASVAITWPSEQWWQAYHDPQLNAWMSQALAANPSLKMAAARVRQARAMAGLAEADEAPQVDYRAQLQRKRWPDDGFYGPGSLGRSTSWNNTQGLNLSYNLDLWGRERSERLRALNLAQVAATDERAAALELQGNLLRAYVGLALHFAERDIAQAAVAQQQQLVALAQRRLQAGLGTQLELSQAQTPLPETQRQLDLADEAIALSRHQLAALAGQPPSAGEQLQRPQLQLNQVPALPHSLPLALLGRRPDIVARRWQVAAEAQGIAATKAEFYPDIDLLGSLGSAAVQGAGVDFLRYDKLTYGLGPALTLPIFDGGRLRAQLGERTASYDLAVEHYNQTLIAALHSVADVLTRLHSLAEQQNLVAHSLSLAQTNRQLAEVAHQRGLTDFRAVLQAQTEVFQQQRLQQQVLAAQLSNQAQLWVALGGGVLGQNEVTP
ncbi:NodT family efflux transporter outer membrane factor (OMF) lipoprotein [Pseudomonas sp. TE3786]